MIDLTLHAPIGRVNFSNASPAKVDAERAAKEAFESMSRAQALEKDLKSAQARLREVEKVLSRKESEWVPIGRLAEATTRAERAEAAARGLRSELERQRTALRFARQEKQDRDEELRGMAGSEFELRQENKRLGDELKSANFQLKHLRKYGDILKSVSGGHLHDRTKSPATPTSTQSQDGLLD